MRIMMPVGEVSNGSFVAQPPVYFMAVICKDFRDGCTEAAIADDPDVFYCIAQDENSLE